MAKKTARKGKTTRDPAKTESYWQDKAAKGRAALAAETPLDWPTYAPSTPLVVK